MSDSRDIVDRLRCFAVWNNKHSHYEPVPLTTEAADEIASLRAQLAKAEAGIKDWIGAATICSEKRIVLEAQLASARKALEPFAAFANRFGDHAREDSWVLTNNPSGKGNLTMGDVRRARDVASSFTDDLRGGEK